MIAIISFEKLNAAIKGQEGQILIKIIIVIITETI